MFDMRRAAVHHALGGTAVVGLPNRVSCLMERQRSDQHDVSFARAQTTILATGSALALMTAALSDSAHAETNLEASYTISFARIQWALSPQQLLTAIANTRSRRMAAQAA